MRRQPESLELPKKVSSFLRFIENLKQGFHGIATVILTKSDYRPASNSYNIHVRVLKKESQQRLKP